MAPSDGPAFFGQSGQGPLWPNVKQAFFDDLAVTHDHTGPWNAVLLSGDFVQKGSREEFARLNDEILHPLWERMKELGSEPCLLAVPGNGQPRFISTPGKEVSGTQSDAAARWLSRIC